MPSPTATLAWQHLTSHREQLALANLRDWFAADPGRAERFSLSACGITLDFSKQPVTDVTLSNLVQLASAMALPRWIERMFSGDKINFTEQRAVLHTALRNRSNRPIVIDGEDVMSGVK